MRKQTKRAAAIVMAAAMTTTLLAGCGGSGSSAAASESAESTTSEASSEASTGEAAASGSYTDYSAGFPERVTIQIPVYDRGFENWNVADNYYTQWVQQEFGEKYNVDVEYVAISFERSHRLYADDRGRHRARHHHALRYAAGRLLL